MTTESNGHFVWYELMVPDPGAAAAFYGDVVGWKTQPFAETGEPYTMWVSSQGPLGGTVKLDDEMKKRGVPPHWMAHVNVDDVDTTVAEAKKRGANVLVAPRDIPTVGRFSVFADAQGAVLSVFKPLKPMQRHDSSKLGEFTWNELLATDSEAALRFYGELFAWTKVREHDMGPEGKYLIYGLGSAPFGGMFTKPRQVPGPAFWMFYVEVDDLDGAVARATKRGGKVLHGPMEVPGGARTVQLSDPQGAAFALHESVKKK
jgi:predicted enzyme related to lactoylglutathione lyase